MKVPRLLILFLACVAAVSCRKKEEPPPPETFPLPAPPPEAAAPPAPIAPSELTAFAPLPAAPDWRGSETSRAKVELGRALFHDKRLSFGHDTSCNKCHLLATYGTDGSAFSVGHGGKPAHRNTPSIYGASLVPRLFWDGRAETLEAAIALSLEDPSLMGSPGNARVETTLRSIPNYARQFAGAFPGAKQPVTAANAMEAIGSFVRILVAPSRWDRFLQGDESALTDAQKAGFRAFVETGCADCHAGPLVGGDSLRPLGKARPWPNQSDKGRGHITDAGGGDMTFRVPSLRNVSRTGPYFHDASARSLSEAVRLMASHQLGKDLDDETVRSISGWLDSLTALSLEDTPPELPPSTLGTPKPLRR